MWHRVRAWKMWVALLTCGIARMLWKNKLNDDVEMSTLSAMTLVDVWHHGPANSTKYQVSNLPSYAHLLNDTFPNIVIDSILRHSYT
jgi:hypothetical protein